MKGGIQLATNTIVVIALVVIALILVVGFIIKSRYLFSKPSEIGSQIGLDDLQLIREKCRTTYCFEAMNKFDPSNPSKFKICSMSWDTSKVGGIKEDHCYDDVGNDVIVENCQVTDKYGNTYYVTKEVCEESEGE